MRLLMPPMLLATTSADAIWATILQHPLMKQVAELRERIYSMSKFTWDIHSLDKACGFAVRC